MRRRIGEADSVAPARDASQRRTGCGKFSLSEDCARVPMEGKMGPWDEGILR